MTLHDQQTWQRRVKWDNDWLTTFDNTIERSYLLTDRQTNALLNVIKQMRWQSRWTGAITPDEIDSFASELGFRLMQPADCEECTEYPAWSSRIEWFPNNPYTEPNLVGDGYLFPSWYVVGPVAQSLYDAELNSVITSIERIPIGSWPFIVPASGWPRFRINLSGTGTVEIHLASINAGSLLQTQVDDDLLTLEWVDVQQDQIALPPETANAIIIEREFTTAGDHHIDCTIVPQLQDTPIPLGFGGGLVKIVLCGFQEPYGGTGSDLAGLAMRLNAQCEMEFSIDGGNEWDVVEDWVLNANSCFLGATGAAGIDGIDGDDGIDGTDGIDGDDGQTANEYPPQPTQEEPDELCGAAWYIAEQMEALIQDAIIDAETITLEEFLEAVLGLGGFSTSFLVLFWDWLVVTVDQTLSAEITIGMDFVAEHLYCNELDISQVIAAIANDTGYSANARTGWTKYFEALDDGFFALRAFIGAQDDTRDCSSFACVTWTNTFDFTIEGYEWFASSGGGYPADAGHYVAATGWRSDVRNKGGGDNSVLSIVLTMPFVAQVTRVLVEFTADVGGAGDLHQARLVDDTTTTWLGSLNSSVGSHSDDFTGLTEDSVTDVKIDLHSTFEARTFTITKVIIEGTGTDPSLGV